MSSLGARKGTFLNRLEEFADSLLDKVTLNDVARSAGVSTATVSRAINTPERVAKATLERVQAALAETGYVPNLLAGGLASSRSRMVAFLLPSIPILMFHRTFQALTNKLAENRYQALLGLTGRTPQEYSDTVNQVLSWRPQGLVMIGTSVSPETRRQILSSGCPVVEIWDLPDDPIDMVVGFSNEAVGLAIGRYAIAKGYRRPFVVAAAGMRGLRRRFGLTRAFVEAGLDEPRSASFHFPTKLGEARQALAEHLDAGGRPDIVICSSDAAAHGAIIELHTRGIRIPDDIAVTGFGDFDFAEHTVPTLTTVRIDGDRIGELSATMLLDRIAGKPPANKVIDIGFELIARESA